MECAYLHFYTSIPFSFFCQNVPSIGCVNRQYMGLQTYTNTNNLKYKYKNPYLNNDKGLFPHLFAKCPDLLTMQCICIVIFLKFNLLPSTWHRLQVAQWRKFPRAEFFSWFPSFPSAQVCKCHFFVVSKCHLSYSRIRCTTTNV